MTGVAASVALESSAALQGALERMRQLGDNPRRIWEALGTYGESSTRRRFKKSVGPGGARWKPSARALASGGRTLEDKGAYGGLLGSITHRADANSAEWGTNKIYAGTHQFGGVIVPKSARSLRFAVPGGFVSTKRVTMPARPFLGVDAEDGQALQEVALDVVRLAEAGRGGSPGADRAR